MTMINLAPLLYPVAVGITLLTLTCVWSYFTSSLRKFDGPFLAKFTNAWRLMDVSRGRCDITQNKLHQKYGPAVRMGPNLISLSDPGLIKIVYGFKPIWKKSRMYEINDVLMNGVRVSNLFNVRDDAAHGRMIRPGKHLYSMTKVKELEPLLDPVIDKFSQILETKFINGPNAGKSFDAAEWLTYFTWDAISQVTLGQQWGFMDAGQDVGGYLASSRYGIEYFAKYTQMPELDYLFDKNPIYPIGGPSFAWGWQTSLQAIAQRNAEKTTNPEKTKEKPTKDFLDRLLDIRDANPESGGDNMVLSFLVLNVLAGSDTTGVTLNAAVYHILKNPIVYARLVTELTTASVSTPIQWSESVNLPYLNAVVQETLRIHPGVPHILERDVPAGGLTLPDGRHIAEGTIVGMNSWVVHQNEDYFGPDTKSFRPERWMIHEGETEESFRKREAKMKEGFLAFGRGSRICIGRNLSLLVINKLIATLFRSYELQLVDQDKEWTVENLWFAYTKDIQVTIKKRMS